MAPAPLADRRAARRRRRGLRLLQARRQRSAARERSGPLQLARRGSLSPRPDRALDGQAPGRARPCGGARAHERADRAALARRATGPDHGGGARLPRRRPGGAPLGARRDRRLCGDDHACTLRALHVLPRAPALARIRGLAHARTSPASNRHCGRARRARAPAPEPHAGPGGLARRRQRRHAQRPLPVQRPPSGRNPRAQGRDRGRRPCWRASCSRSARGRSPGSRCRCCWGCTSASRGPRSSTTLATSRDARSRAPTRAGSSMPSVETSRSST